MKHAYLIMSHNNFNVLKILIKLLDYENNDIYIHIDASVKSFNSYEYNNLVKYSNIYFVNRVSVCWSTYSHVNAMKNLLLESTKYKYDYYHMLSGADLPLKSIEEINEFFKINKGKEFVSFNNSYNADMIRFKYFLVRFYRHSIKFISINAKRFEKILRLFQKIINYDQRKNINFDIHKGYDWFSITHETAKLLIEKESEFKVDFERAFCPSEFFVQNILYNSHLKDNIYDLINENNATRRYIDWERGDPYVFRKEDFELLMKSEMLFARKFMENVDFDIVHDIFIYLKNNSKKI